MHTRAKGREAEDAAAEFLLEKGYTIITRRYHTRHGEIDLIALDGETLVFIEVKQRSAQGYPPEEGIGAGKVNHLSSAARQFIRETKSKRASRYDVIAMDAEGLRHHQDTFGWQDYEARAQQARGPGL